MKRVLLLIMCLSPLLLCGQNTLSALENMHTVAKGQTWESVAAEYAVSVAELHAANPDITRRKLKKGTLLIIPRKPKPVEVEEVVEQKPESVVRTTLPHLKVGVLLPFSQEKAKMTELYRGLLMAADSVRRSGTDLDIYAWDGGLMASKIEGLQSEFKGLDILFGPTEATQIPAVAEMCREHGIRLVLPFAGGQVLQDYPLVYNATAPNAVVFEEAVKKMKTVFTDANYVVVSSGSPDNQGKVLCETLSKRMSQQGTAIGYVDLEGDADAYESAFSRLSENVVVLDNAGTRSLNIVLARLKDFSRRHPDYRISLIGFPEWQSTTQMLLKDFFAFDTYIISPYYYNVLEESTKRFQRAYEDAFHTPIAQNYPRYAALGFDLGYYFLSGLSKQGDTFEQMQGSLVQEPYQNRFRFERLPSGMSFTNRFVQFIHFTKEEKIEIIR